MAKRNVEGFKMSLGGGSESHLTKAGKEQLFEAISGYIDAKIDEVMNPPTMSQKSKQLEQAEKLLKEMLDAIVIRVEAE